MSMVRDFVQICSHWASQEQEPTIRDFVLWLGDHCGVTPGDVMTDTEFQTCCDLLGATPEEAEDALMETAWP